MDALSIYRRLLFPSPQSSYEFDSHPNETVWIPFNPRGAEEAVQHHQQHQHTTHPTASTSSHAQPPSSPSSPSSLSNGSSRPSFALPSSSVPLSSSPPPPSSELPAFFLPYRGADLLMIQAHGNGIDIGGMYAVCKVAQLTRTHTHTHTELDVVA
jgi:hypothetical protein